MKISELQQRIIAEARELEPYVINTRRHVHMHPETLYEEENTAKFIEEELNNLGKQKWEIIGWKYIEKDRNYTDYDEMVFILKKPLIRVWKKHKNGTGELVKMPRKKG